MGLNPLAPVTDYQSLLNRTFWFTSAAALGAVGLLRAYVPEIETALVHMDTHLSSRAGDMLPIRAGYLLPALGLGLLARVFRLHNHLSHWLGISECFDIEVILPEFARQLGIDARKVPAETWRAHRHPVMHQAFYRFASGNSPQIDGHLVHQALDLWSWFWIGLQSVVVYTLTGLILIAAGSYATGAVTLALTLGLATILLPAIRQYCKRYAIAQVKAIVSDPKREAAVWQALDWIDQPQSVHRSA